MRPVKGVAARVDFDWLEDNDGPPPAARSHVQDCPAYEKSVFRLRPAAWNRGRVRCCALTLPIFRPFEIEPALRLAQLVQELVD